MALYTSLTGLNAANADLSVTANNIANVASTGFKKSRADFSDVFAAAAGQDPKRTPGIGTRYVGARQQYTQGPLQTTGAVLDLAVTGNGFFVTRSERGDLALTRNGQFGLDQNRYIVDGAGTRVMGFPVNADGVASATGLGAITGLRVPETLGLPVPTSAIDLTVNLPSAAVAPPPAAFDRTDPSTYAATTSTTVFDAGGNPMTATIYYQRQTVPTAGVPTSVWNAHVFVGDDELSTTATPGTPATLTFDAGGVLTGGASTAFLPYAPPGGGAPLSITLGHGGGTTQRADPFDLVRIAQNGAAPGRLDNVSIDARGLVSAGYSNGQSVALGRIAVADVVNTAGLKQLGDARWATTAAAGALTVGQAADGGLGSISSGTLERSNVELTDELVNLIVAQRNFQANAKAVDTDGNMLQSILQIQ